VGKYSHLCEWYECCTKMFHAEPPLALGRPFGYCLGVWGFSVSVGVSLSVMVGRSERMLSLRWGGVGFVVLWCGYPFQ